MEVHLTPEQEAQLSLLATYRGPDADALAQEVLTRYREEEARFVDAVKLGEAELEGREYFTHEELGMRIERLFEP